IGSRRGPPLRGSPHALRRPDALRRLSDVETEAARRAFDQIRLRIHRTVHPADPAPEERDLARTGGIELEAFLPEPHPHTAPGGRLPRCTHYGSRACHAASHSR